MNFSRMTAALGWHRLCNGGGRSFNYIAEKNFRLRENEGPNDILQYLHPADLCATRQ